MWSDLDHEPSVAQNSEAYESRDIQYVPFPGPAFDQDLAPIEQYHNLNQGYPGLTRNEVIVREDGHGEQPEYDEVVGRCRACSFRLDVK